jgi:hypothetical protein
MGCLYYPRKQTSVSYAADCDAAPAKEIGRRIGLDVVCERVGP